MNETGPEADEVTGVVLAGGYSRRFGGRDKALARVGGRPLLVRVVDRLDEVAGTVVVNCRADQREPFADALAETPVPVRFAEDPAPDRGPLFGFRTALARVETDRCALATCDAPFLDPRMVADLAGRLGGEAAGGASASAVRTSDGRVQPTQAVYRSGPAESVCRYLLDSGERRLSALLERLAHRVVPADEVAGDPARSFFDVNTAADRERALEMHGRETESPRGEKREVPTPR